MSRVELLEKYTIDDYRHWKGDWELIVGTPVAMAPSPMVTHQSVCRNIVLNLSEKLQDCYECEVFYEIDWIVDEENVVRPDVIVVCKNEDREYITKAPKIIFEVISKSTAHKDRVVKYKIYEQEGVKYYAIVDPENKVAKIYELKSGRYIKLIDATFEKVKFQIEECELEMDFDKIWRR